MKKLYIYIILLLSTMFLFSSCNDEWEDELYVHMVGLKAPINYEDVSRIYLRYKPEGETTFNLPVIVSGSTKNDKDLDVRIEVDNDTLAILNEEKYMHRDDLYYRQLEAKHFKLPEPSICHIPAGSSKELYPITFNFEGINLVEKWVLPLTIQDDPSYVMNMYKGWRKALLYINLFNDYSGGYTATNMQVYFGEETEKPTTAASREARVVDENTVFFYAGIQEELSEERGLYKIIAKFEEPTEVTVDGDLENKKGNLTVTAESSDEINFQLVEQATYEISERMDDQDPFLKRRRITMYIKYNYTDVTSASVELPYRCSGSMSIERKIDTRVPDEDQAIMW